MFSSPVLANDTYKSQIEITNMHCHATILSFLIYILTSTASQRLIKCVHLHTSTADKPILEHAKYIIKYTFFNVASLQFRRFLIASL